MFTRYINININPAKIGLKYICPTYHECTLTGHVMSVLFGAVPMTLLYMIPFTPLFVVPMILSMKYNKAEHIKIKLMFIVPFFVALIIKGELSIRSEIRSEKQ